MQPRALCEPEEGLQALTRLCSKTPFLASCEPGLGYWHGLHYLCRLRQSQTCGISTALSREREREKGREGNFISYTIVRCPIGATTAHPVQHGHAVPVGAVVSQRVEVVWESQPAQSRVEKGEKERGTGVLGVGTTPKHVHIRGVAFYCSRRGEAVSTRDEVVRLSYIS